jgi:hypothetical protein
MVGILKFQTIVSEECFDPGEVERPTNQENIEQVGLVRLSRDNEVPAFYRDRQVPIYCGEGVQFILPTAAGA